MEFNTLTEMLSQSKIIMINFIREIVGEESKVTFNDNAYVMYDNIGRTYRLTDMNVYKSKILVTRQYDSGGSDKINILQLTTNELYVLCKMIDTFKDADIEEVIIDDITDNQ